MSTDTDRELLEAAARAAGKTIVRHAEPGDSFTGVLVDGDAWAPSERWNPLADDGDALRLAVKLRLLLDLEYCCAQAPGTEKWFGGGEDEEAGVSHDECDPYAATRRAIVRAAAAMAPAVQEPT